MSAAPTADQAFNRWISMDWGYSLDIGSGSGEHARLINAAGKNVIRIDPNHPADYECDYLLCDFGRVQFDGIWASHVLEHQVNPGLFLRKMFRDLVEDGVLAITVPPLKHEIVGGHVTLWNAGLLLYNLVLAGFDCSEAMVGTYGYNVSVIVRRRSFVFPTLKHGRGDIEALAPFFPCPVEHGFNGQLPNINW